LVALAALALRDLLPLEQLSLAGERVVGVVLIGLGAWGFYGLRARRTPRDGAGQSHAALLVGALHGLAGSAHLIGILPALALSTGDAIGWVLGFATGTIAAMVAFSAALGSLAASFQRPLVGLSSTAAVVVGVWWLVAT
jgi:sulfite exporter TauE/SafE